MFDGRECDKQIDYFRAIRAGTDCIEAEYCMSLCFNGKTLTYLSRYFLLPFVCVENASRNLTSQYNFQG